MERRDFINIWIRYLLLALLGIISITAWLKSRDADNKDCIAGNLCNSCGKAAGCNLPQKVSQKEMQANPES